jgi:hypothetical protein
VFLGNAGIHIGVDKSYGGTILQLQGQALDPQDTGNVVWGENLIDEHGGAACQLSLWGGDSADSVPTTCNGAPQVWDPIQAQGAKCGWDDPSNDVVASCFVASDDPSSVCGTAAGATFYTKQVAPNNFTLVDVPVSGLTFEQWVTPYAGYAKIRYQITASSTDFNFGAEHTSPVNWDRRPQEIPAIYAAQGVSATAYSYTGGSPYTDDAVKVMEAPDDANYPDGRYVELPGAGPYAHGGDTRAQSAGCATENWWGVCDGTGTKCLTVATFDTAAGEGWINGAYVTPIGAFAIGSGFIENWSIYLFPYRYDQTPPTSTSTVRQIIYRLASASGIGSSGRTCP